MPFSTAKHGIEQLVYSADAGDVTFNGEDILLDNTSEITIERILQATAKGTERKQGNKPFEFEFMHTGSSAASNMAAVETDEGNLNDFAVWQEGSGSADHTESDVNLVVVREVYAADPEGVSGVVYRAKHIGA
jgi:hypothetical protein